MKKEFSYELSSPLMVSAGGKQIEGKAVLVKSPRPKDKLDAMSLEAVMMHCMLKAQSNMKTDDKPASKSRKKSDKDEDEGLGFTSLVMMGATKDDIQEMLYLLASLLCEGNKENPQATIDGEKFTQPLFDELSMIDTKAILGRYFADFLSST